MTSIAPPRIAAYLLKRFLLHDEALVGDLFEEFGRRRSRRWLWRQVVAAVVITPLQLSVTIEGTSHWNAEPETASRRVLRLIATRGVRMCNGGQSP